MEESDDPELLEDIDDIGIANRARRPSKNTQHPIHNYFLFKHDCETSNCLKGV